jgi:hypothetical protein
MALHKGPGSDLVGELQHVLPDTLSTLSHTLDKHAVLCDAPTQQYGTAADS